MASKTCRRLAELPTSLLQSLVAVSCGPLRRLVVPTGFNLSMVIANSHDIFGGVFVDNLLGFAFR